MSPIEEFVEWAQEILVDAVREATPWPFKRLASRIALTVARVVLEVAIRMVAPAVVPFLREIKSAFGHVLKPEWLDRLNASLLIFETQGNALHPATRAAFLARSPALLTNDEWADQDPSLTVFSATGSPPIPPRPGPSE
jgi:hypothetical protein